MTAYVIAQAEHRDGPEVRRYRELAQESVARYGGRYLARGALPEPLEGDWPADRRLTVLAFPSREHARRWYASPEYAAARATRSDLAGRQLLCVADLDEAAETPDPPEAGPAE
ncbi:DUF1330 domain-containing protein [Streptomyces sp. DSM 44915]|uniref:DUF1330 domain-containing protein n=1 Tax=Streptomyces chisholmiae TaxID=3075540 RepID=A0ABU2JUR9_9ACTN|nr:DUF1330 domain-containing protein [Streptomyces sp. DSM 44915]MDT0268506.1 DUF1330 domain-containing protein [Streptomyces sp. DSM 44915]